MTAHPNTSSPDGTGPLLRVAIPAGLLLLFAIGCSRGASHAAYSPNADVARKAVEAALTAWQQGQAATDITVDGMKVQGEDFEWLAGKKLQSFEILEQLDDRDGSKQFRVNITLVGARAPQSVSYYVLGRDPLWVCRDKNFEQLNTM